MLTHWSRTPVYHQLIPVILHYLPILRPWMLLKIDEYNSSNYYGNNNNYYNTRYNTAYNTIRKFW